MSNLLTYNCRGQRYVSVVHFECFGEVLKGLWPCLKVCPAWCYRVTRIIFQRKIYLCVQDCKLKWVYWHDEAAVNDWSDEIEKFSDIPIPGPYMFYAHYCNTILLITKNLNIQRIFQKCVFHFRKPIKMQCRGRQGCMLWQCFKTQNSWSFIHPCCLSLFFKCCLFTVQTCNPTKKYLCYYLFNCSPAHTW